MTAAEAPATVPQRKVGILLGIGIFFLPLIFAWFLLRKGHSTLSRVLGFGWMTISLIAVFAINDEDDVSTATPPEATRQHKASESQSSKPKEPLPEYKASEIAAAYEENTVAADRQFKGKRFIVTGIVTDINTDMFGGVYFTFKNHRNQFSEPHFSLKKGYEDYAANVRKGETIRLECTGGGDVVKTAMNKDCVPLD